MGLNVIILPVVTKALLICPGARLTNFYRDASSALLQLVKEWLNFTYSRLYAFRLGSQNKNTALDKNRTYDSRSRKSRGYLLNHSGDEGCIILTAFIFIRYNLSRTDSVRRSL